MLGGGSGRVRPGRGQPRAHRHAVPRRVPAVQRRHRRGAAPAAGERRGDDRARRGVGDLPGAHDGGHRLQPVPLRRLPPDQPGQPLHLHGAAPPRLPQEAQRPGHRPHRHRPARRAGRPPRGPRPARPPGAHRPDPGPGERRRGHGRPSATPARGWRLNADVPGPAAHPLPARRGRDPAARGPVHAGALTGRGATRVHRVAWTVADLRGRDRPGRRARRGAAAAAAPGSR